MADRVRVKHLRELGFCLMPGTQEWCKANGVDFKTLVREGIPISQVEQLDDLFARRAVEQARKDNG